MYFPLKLIILLWLKNLKWHLNLKFNRENDTDAEGAAKLGEGVSKLVNLNSLNLNL